MDRGSQEAPDVFEFNSYAKYKFSVQERIRLERDCQWEEDIIKTLKPLGGICTYDIVHSARIHKYGKDYDSGGTKSDFESLDKMGHVPITPQTKEVEKQFRKFAKTLLKKLWCDVSIKHLQSKGINVNNTSFTLVPIGSYPADTKVGDLNEFDYLCLVDLPLKKSTIAPLNFNEDLTDDSTSTSSDSSSISSLSDSSDDFATKARRAFGRALKKGKRLIPKRVKKKIRKFKTKSKKSSSEDDSSSIEASSQLSSDSEKEYYSSTLLLMNKEDEPFIQDKYQLGDYMDVCMTILTFMAVPDSGCTYFPNVSNIYNHGPATCIELSWLCSHNHTHMVGVDLTIGSKTKDSFVKDYSKKWIKANMSNLPSKFENLSRKADDCIFIYPMYSSSKKWLITSCSFDNSLYDIFQSYLKFDLRRMLRSFKLVVKFLFPEKYTFSNTILQGAYSGSLVSSHTLKCLISQQVRKNPHKQFWGSECFNERFIDILECMLSIKTVTAEGLIVWPVCKDIITDTYVSYIKDLANDPFAFSGVLEDINDLIQILNQTRNVSDTYSVDLYENSCCMYVRVNNEVHIVRAEQLQHCVGEGENLVAYSTKACDSFPCKNHPLIVWCRNHLKGVYEMNRGADFTNINESFFKFLWSDLVRKKRAILSLSQTNSIIQICNNYFSIANVKSSLRNSLSVFEKRIMQLINSTWTFESNNEMPSKTLSDDDFSDSEISKISSTTQNILKYRDTGNPYRPPLTYVTQSDFLNLGYENHYSNSCPDISTVIDESKEFIKTVMSQVFLKQEVYCQIKKEKLLTYYKLDNTIMIKQIGSLALDLAVGENLEYLEFLCYLEVSPRELLTSQHAFLRDSLLEHDIGKLSFGVSDPTLFISLWTCDHLKTLVPFEWISELENAILLVEKIGSNIGNSFIIDNKFCIPFKSNEKLKLNEFTLKICFGVKFSDFSRNVLVKCSRFPNFSNQSYQFSSHRMYVDSVMHDFWELSSIHLEQRLCENISITCTKHINAFTRSLQDILSIFLPKKFQGITRYNLPYVQDTLEPRTVFLLVLDEILHNTDKALWTDDNLNKRLTSIIDIFIKGGNSNDYISLCKNIFSQEEEFVCDFPTVIEDLDFVPLKALKEKLEAKETGDMSSRDKHTPLSSDFIYLLKDGKAYKSYDKKSALVKCQEQNDPDYFYQFCAKGNPYIDNQLSRWSYEYMQQFVQSIIIFDLTTIDQENLEYVWHYIRSSDIPVSLLDLYIRRFDAYVTYLKGDECSELLIDMPLTDEFLSQLASEDIVYKDFLEENGAPVFCDCFPDYDIYHLFDYVKFHSIVKSEWYNLLMKLLETYSPLCLKGMNMTSKTIEAHSNNGNEIQNLLAVIGETNYVPYILDNEIELCIRYFLQAILQKVWSLDWLEINSKQVKGFNLEITGDFPCDVQTDEESGFEYLCILDASPDNCKLLSDGINVEAMSKRVIDFIADSQNKTEVQEKIKICHFEGNSEGFTICLKWLCPTQHKHKLFIKTRCACLRFEDATTHILKTVENLSDIFQYIPNNYMHTVLCLPVGLKKWVEYPEQNDILVMEGLSRKFGPHIKSMFRGLKVVIENILPFKKIKGDVIMHPLISTHCLLYLFCTEADICASPSEWNYDSIMHRANGVIGHLLTLMDSVPVKEGIVSESRPLTLIENILLSDPGLRAIIEKENVLLKSIVQHLQLLLHQSVKCADYEEFHSISGMYILHEGKVHKCETPENDMFSLEEIQWVFPFHQLQSRYDFKDNVFIIKCHHYIHSLVASTGGLVFDSIKDFEASVCKEIHKDTDCSKTLEDCPQGAIPEERGPVDDTPSPENIHAPEEIDCSFLASLPDICTFPMLHKARSEVYGEKYPVFSTDSHDSDLVRSLAQMCHVPNSSRYCIEFENQIQRFVKYLLDSIISKHPPKLSSNNGSEKDSMSIALESVGAFASNSKVGDLDEFSYHCKLNIHLSKDDKQEHMIHKDFHNIITGIEDALSSKLLIDQANEDVELWDFPKYLCDLVHICTHRVKQVHLKVHTEEANTMLDISWSCPEKHNHSVRINLKFTSELILDTFERHQIMKTVPGVLQNAFTLQDAKLRFAYSPYSKNCWKIELGHVFREAFQHILNVYPKNMLYVFCTISLLLDRIVPKKIVYSQEACNIKCLLEGDALLNIQIQNVLSTNPNDWTQSSINHLISVLEEFTNGPAMTMLVERFIWPQQSNMFGTSITPTVSAYDLSILFGPRPVTEDICYLIELLKGVSDENGSLLIDENITENFDYDHFPVFIRLPSGLVQCKPSQVANQMLCTAEHPELHVYDCSSDINMAYFHHPFMVWCRSLIRRLYTSGKGTNVQHLGEQNLPAIINIMQTHDIHQASD